MTNNAEKSHILTIRKLMGGIFMSWMAISFWGIGIVSVAVGFYFQKKSGAKAVEIGNDQNLDRQIRRNTINNGKIKW